MSELDNPPTEDQGFVPVVPTLQDALAQAMSSGASRTSSASVMDHCPHCGAELLAHGGVNAGFFHCNGCGCCFDAQGNMRPDHPICTLAAKIQAEQAEENALAAREAISLAGKGK